MAKLDEQTHRILLLLKLDAQHLYERVQLRAPEYMLVFSNRRTRDQFKEIFRYRYEQVTISELKLLSPELIIALDDFYSLIDKIKWHLYYTEDMPKTVEDWLYRQLAMLEKKYFNLELYINAEYDEDDLSVSNTDSIEEHDTNALDEDLPSTLPAQDSDEDDETFDVDDL